MTGLRGKKGGKEEKKEKEHCNVNSYGESESSFERTGVQLAGASLAGLGAVVGGRDKRAPKRDTG